MLTRKPGIHKVTVATNIGELFALETRITSVTPEVLDTGSPEAFLNFLTERGNSKTFICNDSAGNLVGYMATASPYESDNLEVLSIAVDPDYQSQGHGKHMMQHAEAIARQSNKRQVTLATSPENLAALSFYKTLGYEIHELIENYYGDNTPRYVLQKIIDYPV